jgi:hypothetical protein
MIHVVALTTAVPHVSQVTIKRDTAAQKSAWLLVHRTYSFRAVSAGFTYKLSKLQIKASQSEKSQNTKKININPHVRFEVFMAVTMKNAVFWDVTACGSCKNRRFGGT